MTPSDLKHYLMDRRQATLAEMARHFGTEPAAVEGALDLWLRKGKVVRRTPARCSGCNQCNAQQITLYEWQA